jgi:hypothetical protein
LSKFRGLRVSSVVGQAAAYCMRFGTDGNGVRVEMYL